MALLKLEDLTIEKLRSVILPDADSIYFNNIFEEIKRDLGNIANEYDREREFVIYCFIRLCESGVVFMYDYFNAYNNNRKLILKCDEEYKKFKHEDWKDLI